MNKTERHAGVLLIPYRESRSQHVVVNSRFITTIGPAADIESAKSFIARIKNEFSDASHNVPAYIIGGGKSSTEYCSDDGEPAGTAGRPVLTVLRGSGLGNVVLVITRYFGGTKLGTGGLVRAYTESAQLAVSSVPRARTVKVHNLSMLFPYNQLERIRALIKLVQGEVISESFTESVEVSVNIPFEMYPVFQNDVKEISAGKIKPVIISTTDILVPIPAQS